MPDVRMPDGTILRGVPDNATRQQIADAYARARQNGAIKDNRPTSFWQGVAEGIAEPVTNMATAFTRTNPLLGAADMAYRALGLGDIRPTASAAAMRRLQQTLPAKSSHRASTAGRITGEVIGTLPTLALPGGAMAQGAAGGALLSKDIGNAREVATNAAIGVVGGKLGDVVGRRVVAPVLERAGRTAPVRKLAKAAAQAVGKKPLPLPKISKPERKVMRTAPNLSEAKRNLDDAVRLGMPYALADATPELRSLAGSVSRKSGSANALAERTFAPRALGQAERATEGIDKYLAPITDIEQRAKDIRAAARAKAQPFYDAAFAQPAPVDPQLDEIVRRPAGQEALKRAEQIMANEGASLDIPTFETLDYTKRGLDSVLNDNRNPLTGKLDLEGDPLAASVNRTLQDFKGRLDELNPDYAAARQAYQEAIQPRTALRAGYDDLAKSNLPLRQFEAGVQALPEGTLPDAQSGYATALADRISNVAETGNPYARVYGSPNQQAKVAAMFPEGADNFARQAQLEADMSKTAWETLGGSPTQRRAMADQMFDTNVGDYGQVALSAVANPKMALLRGALQKLEDTARTRGEKRAAELAPVLFDTSNPANAAAWLDDLMRKQAEQELRRRAYERLGGTLALPASLGAIAANR